MNKKNSYIYYIVYVITSFKNDKKYVGWHSTNNLNDDYFGSGKIIKSAIKKYGKENFKRDILEICDEFNVLEKEIFWIKELNTIYPNGYNLTNGGDGRGKGFIVSKETRLKMGASQLGRKHTSETIEKMKLSQKGKNKGKKHTKEQCELQSQQQKGKILSQTTIEKMLKSREGYSPTEETKEKIRHANKNLKRSEETKEHMRLARSGKTFDKILKHFV